MTAAARAIAVPFLEAREGVVLRSYHGAADRPGVWTVGTGFTQWNGKPVGPNLVITQAQNDAEVDRLLGVVERIVDAMAPPLATDEQRAALYSFAWNEGTHAFATSALALRWQRGDVIGAANCFYAWCYANGQVVPGLVKRRALEKALFLTQPKDPT